MYHPIFHPSFFYIWFYNINIHSTLQTHINNNIVIEACVRSVQFCLRIQNNKSNKEI